MFTNRLFLLPIVIALLVSACAPNEMKVSTSFQQWHITDALQAFRSAGLPIVIPQLTRDERDLFSGEKAVEGKQFVIPGQGDPALERGIIFSFQNKKDLQEIQNYYAELNNKLPQYKSWIFIKDNLLLQINSNVPEKVAKQYAQALDRLDE